MKWQFEMAVLLLLLLLLLVVVVVVVVVFTLSYSLCYYLRGGNNEPFTVTPSTSGR